MNSQDEYVLSDQRHIHPLLEPVVFKSDMLYLDAPWEVRTLVFDREKPRDLLSEGTPVDVRRSIEERHRWEIPTYHDAEWISAGHSCRCIVKSKRGGITRGGSLVANIAGGLQRGSRGSRPPPTSTRDSPVTVTMVSLMLSLRLRLQVTIQRPHTICTREKYSMWSNGC